VPPAPPSAAEIAARIEASRARRRRPLTRCPACGIGVARPAALHDHMSRCCADLLDPPRWARLFGLLEPPRAGGAKGGVSRTPAQQAALDELLAAAAVAEEGARDKV
jgi:hypothetical protein